MSNNFLFDFALAVLAYFLFSALLDAVVSDAQARQVFKIILIIACVLFALFGTFLPF